LVNVDRVAGRVLNDGHNVPKEKIIDRYQRSLNFLIPAIKNTNRAYLYDNSGTVHELVAEITDGRKVDFDTSFVPLWFEDYVLNKI
jgi:predicted ABC-type ATPase